MVWTDGVEVYCVGCCMFEPFSTHVMRRIEGYCVSW